ncbi:hypothetical protein LLG96_16810 [bacterium]|nr:hypothetical protein [bacterium]
MVRIRDLITIQFLLIMLIITGAGCDAGYSRQKPVQPENKGNSGIFTRWTGAYTGTAVYVYGPVTDKKGNEGIPARLVIEERGGQAAFELGTTDGKFRCSFIVPVTVFSSSAAEFSRTETADSGSARYTVSAKLTENGLNGTLKISAVQPDGGIAQQGGWLFEMTKNGR